MSSAGADCRRDPEGVSFSLMEASPPLSANSRAQSHWPSKAYYDLCGCATCPEPVPGALFGLTVGYPEPCP